MEQAGTMDGYSILELLENLQLARIELKPVPSSVHELSTFFCENMLMWKGKALRVGFNKGPTMRRSYHIRTTLIFNIRFPPLLFFSDG